MKRLLTILFIAFSMGLFAQTGEIKPITCKALQTPNNATFYFNPPDTTLRVSMGTYGILEIAGAKRYQRKLKITTTGTSGASTLIDGTLNIPQYSGVSSGAVAATTATAIGTAEKTTTITSYTLKTGDFIALTLTNGNSVANATLAVNGGAAKQIRINNVQVNTTVATLAAGAVIILYYDGTYFQMVGSQRTADTNTDTYDRTYWNNTITAGLAIYDYKMLMQGTNGKFYPITLETGTGTTKTVLTTELRIGSPILYYNSTTDVATNGTTANVYSEFPLANMTYTTNVASWTSQLPIYLKGTVLANGNFKLDNTSTTSWITQTLPTTDDGFVYILLGQMYSTTAMRLMQYHPIYQYKNGAIRLYTVEFAPISGSTNYVQVSPSSAQAGNIWMNGTIGGTTVKLTNLTDGYLPYHISGASGLGNSPIYTDGTNTKITSNQNSHPDLNLIGAGTNQGWLGISDGNNYGIQGGSDYEGMNFLVSGVNALRIRYTGQIGMGYSTDSPELINNKLAVNGSGYFNGTVNSTGYLLNGSNLFSSLTSGKITKWDGTKLTPIVDGTNGQVLGTDGNGGYSWVDKTTGTLSGTNVTWDYSIKKNYNITLTGNTVITITNVSDGDVGTLYVTNAAIPYTLTFAGYVNSIDSYIRLRSNMVITSGGSKSDDYTFKYNGTKLTWHGALDTK